jgi:methionyl-tRNA formyltransferase
MPLRTVFFGTPQFAVPTLRALLASSHPVVGVITQPDRRRGRGQKLTPGAVKRVALEHDRRLFQPEGLKDAALASALEDLAPDLGVVAAYGRLIPDRLLTLPRLGIVNVHASLLPRWRGAAPVHRAILAGDPQTGVTIMRVVRQLDAGPVLASAASPIGPTETSGAVEERLAELGAGLLVETVDRLASGRCPETPQDESLVTYAPRLERHESQIDWARPAGVIHDQIRGLHPWPHAAALFVGRRVIFLRSAVVPVDDAAAPPGTVVAVTDDGIDVAAAPGVVRILELQVAGRAAVTAAAFLRGHATSVGDRFEPLPST